MNKSRSRRAYKAARQCVAFRVALALCVITLAGCFASACSLSVGDVSGAAAGSGGTSDVASTYVDSLDIDSIASYSGEAYVQVNGNEPTFTAAELSQESFESYSPLDSLGRCRTAYALVGEETMPTGERGSISEVHPTGWHSTRYSFIDGENLYNRCHLIAYKLTGENANERNLITGTRYMNATGMLHFEDMVADYIYETGNHVLYRVTPLFKGDELVARGVHMEAESVEDGGAGISFNVYCYNVQPGVGIDYATGDNWLAEGSDGTGDASSFASTGTGVAGGGVSGDIQSSSASEQASSDGSDAEHEYILNTKSMKFHDPSCESVEDIGSRNKESYTGTRESLINRGYEPCGRCNP